MTTLTREEIDQTCERLQETARRLRDGDQEVLRQFEGFMDERVLTEAPLKTPKERLEDSLDDASS